LVYDLIAIDSHFANYLAELFARCLAYLCPLILPEHKSSQRRFDQLFLPAPTGSRMIAWKSAQASRTFRIA